MPCLPADPYAKPSRPRRRPAVLLIALALLPITLLLGWQLVAQVQAARERVDAVLAASAEAVAGSVTRELQASIDALDVLSQSELFQQGRIAALGRLLQGRPRRDWDSLFVFDRDGGLVLDTGPPTRSPTMRLLMEGLRNQVTRTGRPAVSGFIDPAAAPGNAVAIALPVRNGDRVAYVLGARISPATFQRLASASTTGLDDRVTLTDAQFRVVADSSGLPGGVALSEIDPALRAAWRTLPGFGWRVRVAQPSAPIEQAERGEVLHALLTQGGALLLGALLAYGWAGITARRRSRAGDAPAGTA